MLSTWIRHLAASCCAAIVSRVLTHPLDTLRVQAQAPKTVSHQGKTPAPTLRWSWLSQLASLYNGLAVAVALSAPALAVYMGSYDAVKWLLVDGLQLLASDAILCHIIGACIAEITSNLLWTPMELIKSRMQAGQHDTMTTHNGGDALLYESIPIPTIATDEAIHRPSSTVIVTASSDAGAATDGTCSDDIHAPDAHPLIAQLDYDDGSIDSSTTVVMGWRHALAIAHSIWRVQGLAGFLRGYWLGVLIYAPYSCIYFVLYERLKPALFNQLGTLHPTDSYPAWVYMLASALSCALAAALTNPLDVVRTRWQVARSEDRLIASTYSWTLVVNRMWRDEGGLRPFMRGMLARVTCMVPGAVVSWTIFELLRSHL